MPPRPAATVLVTAAVVAGLGVYALGHHRSSIPNGAAVVDISHMAFQPATIKVRVGQPVAWKFEDAGVVHDVVGVSGPTSSAARFHSPNKENGDWVHTFTAPGVYHYDCSLHSYMRGEVIVVSS